MRTFVGTSKHTEKAVARLWAMVEKSDGCWRWRGALTPLGYGLFWISEHEPMPAHRAAYEVVKGAIPDGLVLDHLCRTPWCVNPDHLDPVTQAENIRRGVGPTATRQQQTHCVHGHSLADAKIRKEGWRQCRTCSRRITNAAMKRARERRKLLGWNAVRASLGAPVQRVVRRVT